MKSRTLALAALILLALPAVALGAADVPSPNNELSLPSVQFWAMVIGAAVPLAGYILNHHAPWVSEPVKGIVQAALAAGAGAVYQLLTAGDLAFDTETFQVIGTAVLGAILGHIGYKAAGINAALGGGTNR